jgi:hypothetical protein
VLRRKNGVGHRHGRAGALPIEFIELSRPRIWQGNCFCGYCIDFLMLKGLDIRVRCWIVEGFETSRMAIALPNIITHQPS